MVRQKGYLSINNVSIQSNQQSGRLVARLTSPFSTKIGCIGDKVFGGDLVLSG